MISVQSVVDLAYTLFSQVFYGFLVVSVKGPFLAAEREREMESGVEFYVHMCVMCRSHTLFCFYVKVTVNQSEEIPTCINIDVVF